MIADYKVDYDIMIDRGVSKENAIGICQSFDRLDTSYKNGTLNPIKYYLAHRRLVEEMKRLECNTVNGNTRTI